MSNHKYGPLLTKSEIADCITQSGESYCQACGDEWGKHRQFCSGSDFSLTAQPSPSPAKPARRQSSLSQLALAVLAECGQMTKPELVTAMVARRKDVGKPAYAANIYNRLAAIVASGQIEARRQDKATWLSLPGSKLGKRGKRGKRHTVQGHAVVRRGKARFEAKAEGCPAYSGAATLTFIKP